ncbi:Methyltransferase domain-containing protein [Acinetobacter kyonggiensis]|uniref:Methyltransferase domain-containing protein n=2 Tax=Acinetobacter kyonggiensis TaxID=595670 RepID=A0A1H3KHM2_9GAMM|nr:Methyltransferase domain-containing protein [Acinetobacter kyonggiensis]
MILECQKLVDLTKVENVVDFGCGDGSFVELFNHEYPSINIIGVEKQKKLIETCKLKRIDANFISYDNFDNIEDESQDLFFSQEVVYTIKDLTNHANEIFNKLKKGGYYLFTVGCHINNPTWERRKVRIDVEEEYNAYNYSPSEISKVFFDMGFRVAVKKLPIVYPLVFSYDEEREFLKIEDLIESSENNKLLFVMLKLKYSWDE